MNGKKVISSCKPQIEQIVSDLGYVLVDLEYSKKSTGMVLELFIDSKDGITLNDCEKVSRALDKPLDEINPTNDEPYCLNVSSLGLDRPLTTEYQFNKYRGKEVEVKLYKPDGEYKKKHFEGILIGWTENSVTIKENGAKITLQKNEIAQIVPVINF